MSTTAAPAKDQHLALMHEMGADQYDPMPPDQYLAKLNEEQTLTPRGQQLLAWIQKGCIRLKPGAPRGGRSAYATVDGKRPLRFSDAAAHFGWDMPAVSRVFGEIQAKGYATKDDSGRIRLCGTVTLAKPPEIDPTLAKPKAKITIPDYVRQQFDANPRGREAETAYVRTMELINTINAEAIAGSRAWGEKFLAAVMAYYDVKLRRHTDGEDPEKDASRKVQVNILEMSVQDFLAGIIKEAEQEEEKPVQTTEDTLYSAKTAPVQESYPYSSENREYRVSKSDPEAESHFSCEDSLPYQQEAEAIEPEKNAEPEAAEPPAEENQTLPVDENSKPAAEENNTVVAYVESYFEQPLTPTLREQWANFAHEAEVPSTSAVRFLMEKTAEKERKSYELEGPRALLQFARVDIKRWKKTNRAFIARDFEREEARNRATGPAEPEPQEHPAEALMRTFEISQQLLELVPNHKEAARTRERLAADREKLEQELARLLDRVAADPEHPTSDQDRGIIERLKALLTTKANGAAG